MRYQLESPGVYRCQGCGHGVRTTDPDSIRGCLCKIRDLLNSPCRHLGNPTGESYVCRGCPGSPRIHTLFACQLHTACLPLSRAKGARSCATCGDYAPES